MRLALVAAAVIAAAILTPVAWLGWLVAAFVWAVGAADHWLAAREAEPIEPYFEPPDRGFAVLGALLWPLVLASDCVDRWAALRSRRGLPEPVAGREPERAFGPYPEP